MSSRAESLGAGKGFHCAGVSQGELNGIRVAVGFPLTANKGEVNRHLFSNVATMLAVVLFVMVLAWYGVDALLIKKVQILVHTANRIRSGEISARTGLTYGVDELSHVARAVDESAAELERMLNLLREQTLREPLTSLYNQRYLEESVTRELLRAARDGRSVGVIMVDIDYFKRINDTFGHAGGDKVLVSVADVLAKSVRGGDIRVPVWRRGVCTHFAGRDFDDRFVPCGSIAGRGIEAGTRA